MIESLSYRSILASKTITPTYLKAINTAEELFMSELAIHVAPPTAYHLSTSPISIIKKLRDRIVLGAPGTNPDADSPLIERFVNYRYNTLSCFFLVFIACTLKLLPLINKYQNMLFRPTRGIMTIFLWKIHSVLHP